MAKLKPKLKRDNIDAGDALEGTAPAPPTNPTKPVVMVVDIQSVTPDPENARVRTEKNRKAIQASLRRFGQIQSILVDADGIIRCGNGTHEAMVALGYKKIRIDKSPLRGAEAKAYALVANASATYAAWDTEILATSLDEFRHDESIDLEMFGWNDTEIDAMIQGMGDGLIAPDFQPASIDEQGKLDEKSPIECPNCGHSFTT